MTASPPPALSAEEEPATPVGIRFIALYALGQLGLWAGLLTPIAVTLSVKVGAVDPEGKAASLGLILSAGAFLSMAITPIWGNLSDRTTSRFGRRRPWLAGGALAGAVGLLIMAIAQNVPTILLGWCVTQVGYNAAQAALNAIIPDHVPEKQRGRVSGILGPMSNIGVLVGTALTAMAVGSTSLMFLLPGLFAFVALGLLIVFLPDRPADPGTLSPFRLLDLLRSLWVNPFAHRDFGWAFAGRFLIFTGNAFKITFGFYVITDRLGYSPAEAVSLVFIATLVFTAASVTTATLGGWLSDRTGRRKIFVLVASLIMGVGLLTLGWTTTYPQYLIGSAILGLGTGTYMAVDMALVVRVLPNPDNAAKDLGVFQIANSLPQSLAPLIAPLFLTIGGGTQNYPAAFTAALGFAVLGALTVLPIRQVR
ncbi:MFS transporter [Nonomuraea sp. NPDC050643]|uniref:MFS transporter n=1 Tax=Nonomuraea sp. NPDC050643 TaxID=3155660 RepID=UPI0033D793BF